MQHTKAEPWQDANVQNSLEKTGAALVGLLSGALGIRVTTTTAGSSADGTKCGKKSDNGVELHFGRLGSLLEKSKKVIESLFVQKEAGETDEEDVSDEEKKRSSRTVGGIYSHSLLS
jgi:hypothetical protein